MNVYGASVVGIFVVGSTGCSGRHAPTVPSDEAPAEGEMQEVEGTIPDIGGEERSAVDVGALIQDTIALEVSYRGEQQGGSQDADRIASAVQIVSSGSVALGGGMPRCMPAIWVRFVPPSAEGGLTALFCHSGDAAHFWIPETGAAALDSASSQQLYAALSAPGAFTDPPLLPVAVAQSAQLEITAQINADTAPPSLSFVTPGIRTEPPAGDAQLHTVSNERAEALARDLLSSGFFARAERYYSPRSEAPGTPPPPGSEGPPPASSAPATVTVTAVEGDWYRVWSEAMQPAIFAHLISTIERSGTVSEQQEALTAMSAAIQP